LGVSSEAKTDTENAIIATTKTVTALLRHLMDALPLLFSILIAVFLHYVQDLV
jgi:hypothetical protein